MVERIHFNTGRLYTKEGQRITAIKLGARVWFQDHDRMIIGTFHTALADDKLTERMVMEAYDHNRYHCNTTMPQIIEG
jgi:hypothetical protein